MRSDDRIRHYAQATEEMIEGRFRVDIPTGEDDVVGDLGKNLEELSREIWSRVVYGGQAASSAVTTSSSFLTPSLKMTPPTTSVSSSDLLSRRHRP